jgi:CheY-like chemotaxis protein
MLHILYIDDDREAGLLAVTYLKRYNYRVFFCENTMKAREILKTEKIQLVVSDIGLPVETGTEFYQWFRLQEEYDAIPFIFTSAHAMGFDKTLVEHRDLFIPKPIFFPEFVEKVRKLLPGIEGI